ncbi:hypothetical protein, partial [Chryseobacterium sp. SIMBA_038]|uniref:hypothetical protein n=1 Tax=Chryseobacterium sp. SIMBA_038 TaxID=3085780 RepID=UPI00397B6176
RLWDVSSMSVSQSSTRRQNQRRPLGNLLVDHVFAEVVCYLGAPSAEFDSKHAGLAVFVQPFENRKPGAGLNEDGVPRRLAVLRAIDAHYGRWT